MTSPNAQIYINGSPVLFGFTTTASQTVNFALGDRTGVSTWSVHCLYSDEFSTPLEVENTISINIVNMTGSCVVPNDDGYGAAFILESTVNIGTATENRSRFKIRILAPNGGDIYAVNETVEGNITYGWTPGINTNSRNALPGLGAQVLPIPNSVVLRDGAAAIEASQLFYTGSLLVEGTSNVSVTAGSGSVFLTGAALDLVTSSVSIDASKSNPTILQAPISTSAGIGQTLSLKAQGSTGSGATVGGSLVLSSGNGATKGAVITELGGSPVLSTSINGGGITTLLDSSQSFAIFQGSISQSWYFISGSTIFESTVATFYDLSAQKVFDLNQNGAGASNFTVAAPVTYTFTQAQKAGTGATAGLPLTIQAQQGQAQTGATANNNGGNLLLTSGAAGTGGSGAAGSNGTINFELGGSNVIKLSDVGLSGNAAFVLDPAKTFFFFQANGVGQGFVLQATGGSMYMDSPTINVRDNSNAQVLTLTQSAAAASSLVVASTVTSYAISQADKTTNSGSGAGFTIHAQNETGTTSTGGAMTLASGTGTTTNGQLNLFVGSGGTTGLAMSDTQFNCYMASGASFTINQGGTAQLTVSNTLPWQFNQVVISTATGTATPTSSQYRNFKITHIASLTGNFTMALPNLYGQVWLDLHALVLNGHTYTLTSGSASVVITSAITATKTQFLVALGGDNTIGVG